MKPEQSRIIAATVADEVVRRLEGDPRFAPVRERKPNDTFPVGVLFPLELTEEDLKDEKDLFDDDAGVSRVRPSRHGIMFRVGVLAGHVTATIEFDVWRRRQNSAAAMSEGESVPEWIPAGSGADDNGRSTPRLAASPRTISATGVIDLASPSEGTAKLASQVNLQLANLASRSGYVDSKGKQHDPRWRAAVELQSEAGTDHNGSAFHLVKLILVNSSEAPASARKYVSEHFLRPRIEVDFTAMRQNVREFEPREFRAASLRRDPVRLLALGIGCVARNMPDRLAAETTNAPTYRQPAMLIPTDVRGLDVKHLAETPMVAVREFIEDVAKYRATWRSERARLVEQQASPEVVKSFDEDLKDYEDELARMQAALALLEDQSAHNSVLTAFQCVFEAIMRVNKFRAIARRRQLEVRNPIERLFPFQLGYLLTALPDIVERADHRIRRSSSYDPRADLIWFPTGGGKTEAFQLLALFTAFHDRLNGKERGISAWLRFALRALTVQQTSRLLELVYHAEQIRRARRIGGDASFTLGFFVGEAYTPTMVIDAKGAQHQHNRRLETVLKTLDKEPKKYVFTPECPECHESSVVGEWIEGKWSLSCKCSNPICDVDSLPVLVVDDEIRRYPPTFLVGTIDKISGVGLTRRFQPLLRSPSFICAIHGASVPQNRKDANKAPICSTETAGVCGRPMVACPSEDWGPSMVIIDEVHLLEEELGAFTAQYEAALRYIQTSANYPVAKTVLASATVSEYKDHVGRLTGLEARRFPGAPPKDKEGFWFKQSADVQRFIVGVHPHGKTQEDTILYTLRALHWTMESMKNPLSPIFLDKLLGTELLDDKTREEMLRPYWTALVYVLAKHAGENIIGSLREQMPGLMRQVDLEKLPNGRHPYEDTRFINSDLDPNEQAEIIRNMESPFPNPVWEAICATNSISNGIDIANLNTMVLMGQPRRTAEDIQVTSRTGRRHAGVVVRLFHPIRERDLTHYQLFEPYHVNRDLLVEPVPVNRFSMRSVQRTMPGILMALLYNTDEDRTGRMKVWWADRASEVLNTGKNRSEIGRAIEKIYGVGEGHHPTFDNIVRDTFDNFVSLLESTTEPERVTQKRFPYEPMKSLRDVDEGIEIVHPKSGYREGLAEEFGVGAGMSRSRVQVLFRHMPEAIYRYQGGSALVRTTTVYPDTERHRLSAIDIGSIIPRIKHLLYQDPTLRRILLMPGGERSVEARLELIRPGLVLCEVFPVTLVCGVCQATWQIDPRGNSSTKCPNCGKTKREARTEQLSHIAIHRCGRAESLWVRPCKTHRTAVMRLDRGAQRPSDWAWVCSVCGERVAVMQWCQNPKCKTGGDGDEEEK